MKFNGQALLKARQAKGLSQEALGVAASLTGKTVHNLETGKADNPTLGTIRDLADALGVPPRRLVTLDGAKAKEAAR